jgi:murein DD-endopeptidase MepM/ murein hydrolase activator NlpD
MLTRFRHLHITPASAAKLFAVFLVSSAVTVPVAGKIGYQLGSEAVAPETQEQIASLTQIINSQRDSLEAVQAKAGDDMDALAIRLGQLQAKMMRLESVGQRLAKSAELDVSEFTFSEVPGMGDISDGEAGRTQTAAELVASMEHLEKTLELQDQQLSLLEEMVMVRELREDVLPSGMPVKNGYISSGFGGRIHPISGKYKGHQGVDIPGKKGTPVNAVAAGIVVKAERSGGYGNMVEIRHPDGYTTRYAHNQKNLVKEGELVEKGQKIALLGSTGRSTGPHVHFEVRKDEKPVNPIAFIRKNKE